MAPIAHTTHHHQVEDFVHDLQELVGSNASANATEAALHLAAVAAALPAMLSSAPTAVANANATAVAESMTVIAALDEAVVGVCAAVSSSTPALSHSNDDDNRTNHNTNTNTSGSGTGRGSVDNTTNHQHVLSFDSSALSLDCVTPSSMDEEGQAMVVVETAGAKVMGLSLIHI